MRNLISVLPHTRYNDHWISSDRVNGNPIQKNVKDFRIKGTPNSLPYRFQTTFYEQFACDIVSETVLNYPYPYISEKTLRSIASKRMFILLGAAGSLALLHRKGFITFNDIVDESYDLIQDPEDRFLSVVRAVEKFCSMPLAEIKIYMNSIKERLDYNFHVLQNLQQTELEEFSNILNNDSI